MIARGLHVDDDCYPYVVCLTEELLNFDIQQVSFW